MSLIIERQGGLSGVVQVGWAASITGGEAVLHAAIDLSWCKAADS